MKKKVFIPPQKDYMQEKIKTVEYHIFEYACVVVCCITLKNGFSVIGTQALPNSNKFQQDEIIQKNEIIQMAYENAFEKLLIAEITSIQYQKD